MSDSAWRETVPLVADHHEVFTPTAIGHRGGPPVQRSPITFWGVIDAAERYLDEHGLERPHLAGNSMGGFVALELARRGRAESVTAFSPAGLWTDVLRERVMKRGSRIAAMAQITRGLTPLDPSGDEVAAPASASHARPGVAWGSDQRRASRRGRQ